VRQPRAREALPVPAAVLLARVAVRAAPREVRAAEAAAPDLLAVSLQPVARPQRAARAVAAVPVRVPGLRCLQQAFPAAVPAVAVARAAPLEAAELPRLAAKAVVRREAPAVVLPVQVEQPVVRVAAKVRQAAPVVLVARRWACPRRAAAACRREARRCRARVARAVVVAPTGEALPVKLSRKVKVVAVAAGRREKAFSQARAAAAAPRAARPVAAEPRAAVPQVVVPKVAERPVAVGPRAVGPQAAAVQQADKLAVSRVVQAVQPAAEALRVKPAVALQVAARRAAARQVAAAQPAVVVP
jgi:hypothetical protein